MNEKPILFNTEMVRAILDSRKTQTRRLMKNLPLEEPYATEDEGWLFISDEDGIWHRAELYSPIQRGDVLWVRETWNFGRWETEGDVTTPGLCHTFFEECEPSEKSKELFQNRYLYRADAASFNEVPEPEHWHPSIHMPKEAARIFLRVTDICCERLQDITEQDARAEGLVTDQPEDGRTNINFMCSVDCLQGSARGKFALLWNSTIKKTDLPRYGWDANPWVWVISFKRIERDRLLRYADNDGMQGGLMPAT